MEVAQSDGMHFTCRLKSRYVFTSVKSFAIEANDASRAWIAYSCSTVEQAQNARLNASWSDGLYRCIVLELKICMQSLAACVMEFHVCSGLIANLKYEACSIRH